MTGFRALKKEEGVLTTAGTFGKGPRNVTRTDTWSSQKKTLTSVFNLSAENNILKSRTVNKNKTTLPLS
jgi:hypothetical protein